MIRTILRHAALGVLMLLTACATKPQAPAMPEPPPPVKTQETPVAVRAQIRTDLATGYYERGQLDVALEELHEAVRLDPNNAKAYNLYGLVYSMLGDNAKAEENFKRALAIAPDESDFRHNWGWFLCSHNRVRESIPEFEKAIRNPLYRTPEIALVNAGRCSVAVGEVAAAEIYFRRALTASPNNADASYGLALLAYRSSRLSDARAWIKPLMQQPSPSPEALYLGMCIERKLGDRQAELSYVSQLRNRHPESAETKALATATCE
jgi:type IV pilus assembly protein PilF